jgi:signal transduction histidine kinase
MRQEQKKTILPACMVESDKKKPPERDTTDESLRTERRKTDVQLAAHQNSVKKDADAVVARARRMADSVLSDSRDREDQQLADDGISKKAARGLDDERAREDAALRADRGGEDAAAGDERRERQLALAGLLAFERKDTDLRLEIERTRADEALTSREDVLAIVSHDLRSLLGGIALRAGMLARLPPTEDPAGKVSRGAETIQRLSARMNRLIGDLLDVASIDSGKLSVAVARHDAARLCRDSVEAFQLAASAQGIQFTCESGTDSLVAEFDHERILQVLTNLVGNALKFTGKGGRIALRVERRGDDVCFAVEDSGDGIPSDRLEKIFDRFFQTHDNDRRGLGLGLFIARSLVQAHGGRIWAESTVGRGSTFFFTVPLRPAA